MFSPFSLFFLSEYTLTSFSFSSFFFLVGRMCFLFLSFFFVLFFIFSSSISLCCFWCSSTVLPPQHCPHDAPNPLGPIKWTHFPLVSKGPPPMMNECLSLSQSLVLVVVRRDGFFCLMRREWEGNFVWRMSTRECMAIRDSSARPLIKGRGSKK